MNDRVAEYRGLVESLAHKFVGRNGAEYDDLVQEGLIFVWQTLERGITPSATLIEGRMQNWGRWLGRRDPVPYEAMLPIDDFENLSLDPVPTWDALA